MCIRDRGRRGRVHRRLSAMTRVALRGIRSHPGRFLLSILAVLLGVAFVAGTFSLRAMMSATFDDIVESGTNADTYLRGAKIEATGGDAMGGFAGGLDLG